MLCKQIAALLHLPLQLPLAARVTAFFPNSIQSYVSNKDFCFFLSYLGTTVVLFLMSVILFPVILLQVSSGLYVESHDV